MWGGPAILRHPRDGLSASLRSSRVPYPAMSRDLAQNSRTPTAHVCYLFCRVEGTQTEYQRIASETDAGFARSRAAATMARGFASPIAAAFIRHMRGTQDERSAAAGSMRSARRAGR